MVISKGKNFVVWVILGNKMIVIMGLVLVDAYCFCDLGVVINRSCWYLYVFTVSSGSVSTFSILLSQHLCAKTNMFRFHHLSRSVRTCTLSFCLIVDLHFPKILNIQKVTCKSEIYQLIVQPSSGSFMSSISST